MDLIMSLMNWGLYLYSPQPLLAEVDGCDCSMKSIFVFHGRFQSRPRVFGGTIRQTTAGKRSELVDDKDIPC
jgi:hypothetical protein